MKPNIYDDFPYKTQTQDIYKKATERCFDPFVCCIINGFCLVSDVDRVERFRLTLRFFDDVSTAS